MAVLSGKVPDHVPLTTWCFGLPAPRHLRWETDGRAVPHWYSMRLEHLHTLPHPWTLEDEFKRAETWLSLGMDDVLEVSVPWSLEPDVVQKDSLIPTGGSGGDTRYPVMVREYETPSGRIRHAVRKTGDEGPGWPMQPDCVPLIEDYNIPRAVQHVVTSPTDVEAVKHLFASPNEMQKAWFAERMAKMKAFADEKGLLTQAWVGFGMDAAVWFCGMEGAIMLALDEPKAFGRLMDIIAATDYARAELAVASDAVDMICQRGWYSSTDLLSPALFDQYVFPHLSELTALAHRHGKKFGYVMTTGVEKLGPRLADAGVDCLYFVDPVQDGVALETVRDTLASRMTVVGGTNALSLHAGDPTRIRDEVKRAMDILAPTNRFILHPIDAIFPDTPWEGVEAMIEAWRE